MTDEDRALDEALEETFPASDPPANTVETGITVGEPSSSSGPPLRQPQEEADDRRVHQVHEQSADEGDDQERDV
jgi:hypothetical protein